MSLGIRFVLDCLILWADYSWNERSHSLTFRKQVCFQHWKQCWIFVIIQCSYIVIRERYRYSPFDLLFRIRAKFLSIARVAWWDHYAKCRDGPTAQHLTSIFDFLLQSHEWWISRFDFLASKSFCKTNAGRIWHQFIELLDTDFLLGKIEKELIPNWPGLSEPIYRPIQTIRQDEDGIELWFRNERLTEDFISPFWKHRFIKSTLTMYIVSVGDKNLSVSQRIWAERGSIVVPCRYMYALPFWIRHFLIHRSGWDDLLMSFKLRILYPWLISWAVHKYKSEQKHYKCLFDVGYFPLFVYCVGQTSCNGCARASGFWCKTSAFLV